MSATTMKRAALITAAAALMIATPARAEHADHTDRLAALQAAARALPGVRPAQANAAAAAALAAETPRVSAELLIAISWAESRFDPHADTGRACGPMQIIPGYAGLTRVVCHRWITDEGDAFRVAVRMLEEMQRDPRVHGDLRRTLAYWVCGVLSFRHACSPAKYEYVRRVVQVREMILRIENRLAGVDF